MKKQLLMSSLIVAASALSFSAHATNLDYNTMSVSYSTVEIDDSNLDLSGVSVSGSKLLTDNVFVGATFSSRGDDVNYCYYRCDDIEVTHTQISLAAGYRHELTNSTDIYAAVGYASVDYELKYDGYEDNGDDSGHLLNLGIRSLLTDNIEFLGSIGMVDIGDESETSVDVGLAYHINDRFTVGASIDKSEDSSGYAISARYNF